MKSKKINDRQAWQVLAYVFMSVMAVLAVLPFLLMIIGSLTDNEWAIANGFSYFPKEWSTSAYEYISGSWATIGKAYGMTIVVTIIGTALSIIVTSMFAYTLSYTSLPGVKLLNFLTVFTMLFSGGIVASFYIWSNVFHIRDTMWALVFPNLMMNAFNVILVKNYYLTSVPGALLEAARIDGSSEIRIFWQIVFPLSMPIVATIGLMTAIFYWNDWTNGLYYLSAKNGSQYYTIQLVLNQINNSITFLSSNSGSVGGSTANLPTTTARMAIAVIGVLPIMIAYPFFQKYFAKGITLGAVKG